MIEKRAAGGMGEVYRALDPRLEREVALKIISDSFLVSDPTASPSPAGTPRSRAEVSHERFLREARSAATLNHPNICAIYDVGEQEGQPYLVMELLHGETLQQYLSHYRLTPSESLAWACRRLVRLALPTLGASSIATSSRPISLWWRAAVIASSSRFSISAWPRSRALRPPWIPASLTRKITPLPARAPAWVSPLPARLSEPLSYMSPEQAKGDPLDHRTDLFSLGSVLYEMGVPPPEKHEREWHLPSRMLSAFEVPKHRALFPNVGDGQ